MKKKLLIALLVLCMVMTMIPAAFAATSGVEATIGKEEYKTLEEAVAAANESTKAVTIKLQKRVTVESAIQINNENGKVVTIDFNDRTITGDVKTILEVYTSTTIKNGTIKNTYDEGGTCVSTEAGDITLTMTSMTLICSGSNMNKAVVVDGSGDEVTVSISGSTIDANKAGTAIAVEHKTKLTVSNSETIGYCALDFSDAEGTVATIKNTDLKGESRPVDGATAMVVFGSTGVKLTVDSSSSISNPKGTGILFFGATEDNVVTINAPIDAAKGKVMVGWASDATVTITNSDVKAALAKEGYAFDGNVVDGKGIVMVGSTPYSSLEKAFAKGGTVTLLEDLSEGTVEVLKGKSVTLDLAGFSLSADIENNGTLTLTNSKKTGAFTGDVVNNGALTIKDVVVNGDIQNEKTLTVKSGTVNGGITGGTAASTTVEGGKVIDGITSAKTLAVKAGEITGAVSVEGGTATISGGKIAGGVSVSGGTLTVSGGAVSGSEALYVNGGKATVNGGFFNGDVDGFSGNLTIKAGYFTTDVTDYCPKNSKGEHTLVALPGSYVVDGVTYTYMIAKPLPKGVVVGSTEAVGSVANKLTEAQKQAVADTIDGVMADGLGDLAAAKAAKTEAADSTSVRKFNNRIPDGAAKVEEAEELTVVIVPTVNVKVASYKNGEWTLEVSATLVTKLTTDPDNMIEEGSSANTVAITSSAADADGEEVVISIPLPDDMTTAHIRHKLKNYEVYYASTVENGVLTFTAADGLGTFVITTKVPVAKIGDIGYESLSDAVDAVEDGETITLVSDCSERVKIGKEVSFFFEIEAGVDFSGYLRAGSDYDDESTVDGFYDIVEDKSSGSSGGSDDDDDGLEIEVEGGEDEDDWDEDAFDPDDWKNPYIDVAKKDWFYDAVAYVTYHGMMIGTDDGDTFSPEMTVTRGMVVTMLARLDGVDTERGSVWYEAGMEWAIRNDISDGGDPNGKISREEIVVMMWKFAGAPIVKSDWLRGFPDGDDVSSWAEEAMNWAVAVGLVEGTGEGLEPAGYTHRHELATLFMRYCEDVLEL